MSEVLLYTPYPVPEQAYEEGLSLLPDSQQMLDGRQVQSKPGHMYGQDPVTGTVESR